MMDNVTSLKDLTYENVLKYLESHNEDYHYGYLAKFSEQIGTYCISLHHVLEKDYHIEIWKDFELWQAYIYKGLTKRKQLHHKTYRKDTHTDLLCIILWEVLILEVLLEQKQWLTKVFESI